jgi:hypothetical protein
MHTQDNIEEQHRITNLFKGISLMKTAPAVK